MYRIASNSDYHNGRKFDSMVEAVNYARKWNWNPSVCDVYRDIDRDRYQVVWASDKTLLGRVIFRNWTV